MTQERIIFLSSKDPNSKKDWSGIPYFMYQALKKVYDIEYVKLPSFKFLKLLGYYFGKVFSILSGKKYVFDYGVILGWLYGVSATSRIRNKKGFKFIFSPAGLTETAFIKTTLPIVSFGDCSTLQMFDYYPALMNVSNLSKREINVVEAKSFNKISIALFSSMWAVSFVKERFAVPAVGVLPFGANLSGSVLATRKEFTGATCNLLFVGVDWIRKGGDTVLDIHRSLLSRGIQSRLTVIGTKVYSESIPENVEIIEYLDKNSANGELRFKEILNNTNFLLLPTHADCTPIVIAEAFALGVPVLASNTGGISSMITHNETGFLFELNDTTKYVAIITELCHDVQRYNRISENCINSYKTIFNWDSWARGLKDSVDLSLR